MNSVAVRLPNPTSEGVGTIAVLQAMERSVETGLPVKVSTVLEVGGT